MTGSPDGGSRIPDRFRNPILHDPGPTNYPGPYQVTDAALQTYGVKREDFGTTQVLNPGGAFRVKDCHYALPDGSVGMTFLPVCDTGAATGPDGQMVYGSTLVDALLKQKLALGADDQIYAFMYFIHPELNRGSVLDFVKSDKVQLGVTHMGAYLGNGRTSNAPPLYHDRGWGVKGEVYNKFGYPATVVTLSMADTDQAMLNKNLSLADNVLNYGVRFPTDYKNSQFRPADINTALMFYRDWILEEHYLRSDVTWFTYCAAHKTLVANIGLNLPHNLQAFKDAYGDTEGAAFFKTFSDFHFQVFGTEFTPDLQTTFEPLWKKEGLVQAQIRPFALPEYQAWNEARMAGGLDSFTGFKPVALGVGTPWAPQMGADLIYEFVDSYASFIDAGAIAVCATAFGFMGPATERMGVSKFEYLFRAMPIAQGALHADARIHASAQPSATFSDSAYYKGTFAALYRALGGQDADLEAVVARAMATPPAASLWDRIEALIEGDVVPEIVAWFALEQVRQDWAAIMAGGAVSADQAFIDFMTSIESDIAGDRAVVVSSPTGIQFNTPPSIAHMIGIGMFPCNQHVKLTPIVTVMNYTELEKTPTA